MSAIAGFQGSVLITSMPNVALSNEALVDAGDHKTFNEPMATKRYWDRTATFAVQTAPDGVTWTTASASTYTIRYVTGQVMFASAITGATPSCRISSGAYLAYSALGNGKNWEVNGQAAMLESTVFTGNGGSRFKTYLSSLQGADIKFQQFYADNTFLNIINNSATNLFVVSLLTGRTASGDRYEGYGRLKQDDIKLGVATLIDEGLDIMLDGPLYYFAL